MNTDQRRSPDAGSSQVADRLVAATQHIVRHSGAAAATSRAIADQAGENLAGITYYFGSKESLLNEAFVRTARELLAPAIDALTSDLDPIQKLASSVTALQEILASNHDLVPGYVQTLAAATHSDVVGQELRRLNHDLQATLADELAEQRSLGHIPDWIHPDAMAALLMAVANGVAVSVAVDPDHTPTAEIANQFAALLLTAHTATNNEEQ